MNIRARRILSGVVLSLTFALPSLAAEVKVKIEAALLDAVKLLERLNENGKGNDFRYTLTEEGYQFSLATASEGWSTTDVVFGMGGADASAAVLTPDCKLLFIVARGGRLTQGGALNSVSKEINKKLLAYLKATGALSR